MKIDILCMDGSPLEVTSKTIWGDGVQLGVGGAELALLTMCEEWQKAGHDITLYNSPRELNASSFKQLPVETFKPDDLRDIIINFRSPNQRSIIAKGMKVWWSCDPYTHGDYAAFAPFMDKIVCISPFHANYFANMYHIENTNVIDLPVRVQDYENVGVEKIPNRLIFTSIPDRGLNQLLAMWDKMFATIPDMSLVITSDYRLWGANVCALNEQHRVRWLNKSKVQFMGAIPRKRLIEEELAADMLAYPAIFEELFCIACSEAQYAGAYPVTSDIGALSTTNMGTVINGSAHNSSFLNVMSNTIIDLLRDRAQLLKLQQEVKQKALDRFHPSVIMKQWDNIFKDAI